MNFLDSLRMKGIDYRVSTGDSNEITICCIFCGDDSFKLGINLQKGFANCFKCNWRSRHAIDAISARLKLPRVKDKEEVEKNEDVVFEVPKGLKRLARYGDDSLWGQRALQYLHDRGIDLKTIKKKNVLFSERGKFSYRVVFPVTLKDEIVGLVGRAIVKDQEPRYLNSTGIKALWNIPHKPEETVLLCEGIFKALALEKYTAKTSGKKISVGAMLGHNITPQQVQQLKGARTVVLFPDPDSVGIRGMLKTVYKLGSRFSVFLPSIIPTKQADEMTDEDLEKVLTSIQPFSESFRCKYQFEAMRRGQK